MSDADLIDEMERVRRQNNKSWMDLVRLAIRVAPDEAKAILRDIVRRDKLVTSVAEQLSRMP